jgi:hypothetical protein
MENARKIVNKNLMIPSMPVESRRYHPSMILENGKGRQQFPKAQLDQNITNH